MIWATLKLWYFSITSELKSIEMFIRSTWKTCFNDSEVFLGYIGLIGYPRNQNLWKVIWSSQVKLGFSYIVSFIRLCSPWANWLNTFLVHMFLRQALKSRLVTSTQSFFPVSDLRRSSTWKIIDFLRWTISLGSTMNHAMLLPYAKNLTHLVEPLS